MSKTYIAMTIDFDSVCVDLRSLNGRNRNHTTMYTTILMLITGYPALIFGGWLYETGIVLVLHIQNVRLHCCVWLGVIIGVRCGRTFESASCNFALMRHFAFRTHYNAIMTVHWSSLVEYMMERVPCWRWTSSSYVYIAACEWLKLKVFSICVRRSMKP